MAAILIVDDDPTVRAIAKEILKVDGHSMVEAGDGLEALALVERLPIDVVIVDMLMPRMDGLETIRALRSRHRPPSIIAISSGGLLDADRLLQMASTSGADATLQKPLRLATLRDTLTTVLSRMAVVH